MTFSPKHTFIFVTLLASIYILRNSDFSSHSLLSSDANRALLENFNVTEFYCAGYPEGSPYTDAQAKRQESIREGFRSTRIKSGTLIGMIEKQLPIDKFAQEYTAALLPAVLPFVILSIISLLFCVYYTASWCCPANRCINRMACRFCTPPKSNRMKTIYAVMSVAFMVFTITAAIVGIVFATKIPKGKDQILCYTLRILDEIQNGNYDNNWLGVIPLVNKIQPLLDNIEKALGQLTMFPPILTELSYNVANTSTIMDNAVNNNFFTQVSRADPTMGGTYTPLYVMNLINMDISNGINLGSISGALGFELIVKQQALPPLTDTINSLLLQTNATVNGTIELINLYSPNVFITTNYIADFIISVGDWIKPINQYFSAATGILVGVLIANIVIAVLVIVAVILLRRKTKVFNKSMQFSWCLLGGLMIASWVLATVMFCFTILLWEACDAGMLTMHDTDFYFKWFNSVEEYFHATVNKPAFHISRDVAFNCLHQEADLAVKFGLYTAIDQINGVVATVNEYHTLAQSVYQRLPQSVAIPAILAMLNEYATGQTIDGYETYTDLIKLNSLTNSATNGCTNLNNIFVLNSAQCTSDTGTLYTRGMNLNTANPICIGLDTWENGADVGNLYNTNAFPTNCGKVQGQNLNVYLNNFVASFVESRKSTIAGINTMIDTLKDVANINQAFQDIIGTIPGKIETVNQTVTTLYNMIATPQGAVMNAKCDWAVPKVQVISDIICTGSGINFTAVAICYILVAFMGSMSTFMIFCLAKRASMEEKGQGKAERYRPNVKKAIGTEKEDI